MKTLSTLLAIASVCSALVSAWYWLESSKKKIDPEKKPDGSSADMPVWIAEISINLSLVAYLNRKAALWAAACVITGAIGSFSENL